MQGETKTCPAPPGCLQSLIFLFLSLPCWGQRSFVWDWLLFTAYKHLKVIDWSPGPLLAQLWENVKSEFSGNLEPLQPPQKSGISP